MHGDLAGAGDIDADLSIVIFIGGPLDGNGDLHGTASLIHHMVGGVSGEGNISGGLDVVQPLVLDNVSERIAATTISAFRVRYEPEDTRVSAMETGAFRV